VTAPDAATVRLPSALRAWSGGAATVPVEVPAGGAPLVTVLDRLGDAHPALVRRLRDENGELRRFVNVYVDGEDARGAGGLDTAVMPGAEVLVLPSVAGG
jgi:molybdopterin synthase sulfur carrier subunit